MEQPSETGTGGRSRRRLWIAMICAVLVLAVGGMAIACSNDRGPYTGFLMSPHLEFAAPYIDAPPLSLDEVRRQSEVRIASLREVSFARPCGNDPAPIKLQGAWAKTDEVLLQYSHNVWLRVALPAAADRRTLSIYVMPRRIESGRVRGRPAEITAHGWKRGYFFCGSGFDCEDTYTRAWHPLGAELHWVEDGTDVRLQGPYHASALVELAEKLRFDPA